MSRFNKFYSFSDSESDSEDNDQIQDKEFKRIRDDSDSEEEKRVVKTGMEKKFDELRNITVALKNHKNNRDVEQMLNDFKQLTKCYDKNKLLINYEDYHKFYVRVLVDLEDYITDLWVNKKTLSKKNNQSLGPLRQGVKKYNASEEMSDQIKLCREKHDDYPGELILPTVQKEEASKPEKVEEEEDDSDSLIEEDSSSSDEEEIERYKMNPADRFLKSTVEKQKEKRKNKVKERVVVNKKKDSDDEGWMNVEKHKKTKIFNDDEEINVESVLSKMHLELGKRHGIDMKLTKLEFLTNLLSISKESDLGFGIELTLMIAKINAILKYNTSGSVQCMALDKWIQAFEIFKLIVDILIKNVQTITMKLLKLDEQENLKSEPYVINSSLLSLVFSLEIEFEKIMVQSESMNFQALDQERMIQYILGKVHWYLEQKDVYSVQDKCEFYCREMEHLYYLPLPYYEEEMRQLSSFVIKHDTTDRLRMKATLNLVYFLALQGEWLKAHDIFAMSHISKFVEQADADIKIQFNRVTVQLGVCAFKNGNFRDAHQALSELQGSGHLRELLAQGVKTGLNVQQEEMKKDKMHLLPFHKHINLDMVEGVYLISAMICEVNNFYAHHADGRKVLISRNFHHVLKNHEKLLLSGPPDNIKEHVVYATKAISKGDWRTAIDHITHCYKMQTQFWRYLFNNLYGNIITTTVELKKAIDDKIVEESLKAFLYKNITIFSTITLDMLSEYFEMDVAKVKRIVSEMIINNKLSALIDEPMNCIRRVQNKPTSLQTTTLSLLDKLSQLSELNEKFIEATNKQ